jgi:hypothetical protein
MRISFREIERVGGDNPVVGETFGNGKSVGGLGMVFCE